MSEELKRFDLMEIRKAIAILFRDVKFGEGECIELRMPDKKRHAVIAGWFDDMELMAKWVASLARGGFGPPGSYGFVHDNVYWTANPVDDALLARQQKNRVDIAAATSSDYNVTRRIWLPIDIDPLRPSGVSASKGETKLAQEVANHLLEDLQEIGFPDSCMVGANSGNGFHVLIRIDLPNDDASRDLVKKCLASLQQIVGTPKVEVDPKVFNAARIIKSYGTVSCKGVNTPERPWRCSKLTLVPEGITIASRALLEKLAALGPKNITRRETAIKRQGPWTQENTQAYVAWSQWNGNQVGGGKPGEAAKWVGTCIHDPNHKDAALILHDDGWWSYTCFHSSCAHVRHTAFIARAEELRGEKYPRPGSAKSAKRDAIDCLEAPPAEHEVRAFNLTDAGNMERLVYKCGHLFRHCAQRGWYAWDGKRWVPDAVVTIYQAALRTVREIPEEIRLHCASAEDDKEAQKSGKEVIRWADESESRYHLTAMEFLSQSAAGIAADISGFDVDPWAFNRENGTLDLQANRFRPHAQMDMLTNISPVVYDPNSNCPLWESFLHDVMAGNQQMIGFLQRAAGYSLTGSTAQHCMFICWGTGRNGKSTFLEVLRHVVGTYGKQASMSTFVAKKFDEGIPNDLAALRGARFVTGIETDDGKRLAEAKIKLITGGDTVTARFLYQEYFEFRPTFKIWIATNYRPVIYGTDEGIWRRIRLIPFTVYIPDSKVDAHLREKLLAESAGILNWAVRGLEEFKIVGLGEPDGVIKATADYRAAEDWLRRFMDQETEVCVNATTQARALYERFKSWAKDTNEYAVKERRFNEAMDDHGYAHTKRENKKLFTGFKLADQPNEGGKKFERPETIPENFEW